MVMNTAAHNKQRHPLLWRTFRSFHDFDVAAARRLTERTIVYAEHTPLEQLLNYARVGGTPSPSP